MLTFFQPIWLLLLVPLAVAFLAWPLPNRVLKTFRALVFILAVLGLAQLAIKLPDRAGTVVFVADRSESMPPNAASAQSEMIALLHKSMGPRDELGVVSFGQKSIVEQSPGRGEFGGFTAEVGADHSSLNDALETALALIPPGSGGRILVASDGKWTGKDPILAAARAAGRNIAIDYRALTRAQANDVSIQSFSTPPSVYPGQAFVLSASVQSPTDQEVQYQLKRGDDVISSGSKKVSSGLTRLMFRDRATTPGVSEYTLVVQGPKDDPIPENNTARALVGIEGARPVLIVSSVGEASGLVKILRAGGLQVVGKTPVQCTWSLEQLSQYSAVILENVPAGEVGMNGMQTLANWVEETGSGLALTGGQKSYGPGGYFKSPLERVLPISMEMRREHRKLSVAVVVALDRSGSMAAPAGGGRQKMDLADLGTVQVLDLLSPMDEFGVFAVDTAAHEIVPLDTVDHNASYRNKILQISSMGGGIYIYEALVASARMISTAQAQTKHIILFSDAADAEQSANYQDIVAKLRDANVTVSVVGLGTDHDVDAELLRDIALRGGGECYFSADPDEIPRIFAQDTFTIARSTFIDTPSLFTTTAGYSLLGLPPTSPPPALGGYNLCYIRPEANLAAVTSDEYAAPVVASWNAGNGRVLCFMGEADGKYSGDFAKWNQAGEFYATLARWIAGKHESLPNDLLLTQNVQDGLCYVQLHLDPARKSDSFSSLPRVQTLHGLAGSVPVRESAAMQWKNADLLEATIPISGKETVLNTVEISGQQAVTLPPVCLPYSPEFEPDHSGRGLGSLVQIATTTGGHEQVDLSKMWADLPVNSRYVEMAPWLLIAAALIFLIEIFERRTGWIARIFGAKRAVAVSAEKAEATQPAKPVSSQVKPQPKPKQPSASAAPSASKAPVKPAAEPGAELDHFRKARERASRREDKPR
jgi:Mg-chelatase subunit ChlD